MGKMQRREPYKLTALEKDIMEAMRQIEYENYMSAHAAHAGAGAERPACCDDG